MAKIIKVTHLRIRSDPLHLPGRNDFSGSGSDRPKSSISNRIVACSVDSVGMVPVPFTLYAWPKKMNKKVGSLTSGNFYLGWSLAKQ
jgi:hypothetical protein